jgi:hypothetical protein
MTRTTEYLYLDYKCPLCQHPTLEHILGPVGSTLTCTHKEYYMDFELRTCDCAIPITSNKFRVFSNEHRKYFEERERLDVEENRDYMLKLCRREL